MHTQGNVVCVPCLVSHTIYAHFPRCSHQGTAGLLVELLPAVLVPVPVLVLCSMRLHLYTGC